MPARITDYIVEIIQKIERAYLAIFKHLRRDREHVLTLLKIEIDLLHERILCAHNDALFFKAHRFTIVSFKWLDLLLSQFSVVQ